MAKEKPKSANDAGKSDGSLGPTERAHPESPATNLFFLEDVFPEPANLLASSVVAAASDPTVSVAFDTNALLLPYSASKDDVGHLATAYKKLASEDRLFVPARVLREFARHRDRKLADLVKTLKDRRSRIQIPDANVSPLLAGVDGYAKLADAIKALRDKLKEYDKASETLISAVSGWRGSDPITTLYREVFKPGTIVEPAESREALLSEWKVRLSVQIPPGYKDAGKVDTGIGDFVIWKSLLTLAARQKKDLIFVTGDEKADWFVRADGEGIYPRPELLDEYRRASKGRSLRLSSFHGVLSELHVPEPTVADIREAEAQANTAIRVATSTHTPAVTILDRVKEFDYSTNDGVVGVGGDAFAVALKFSKASDQSIHFYQIGKTTKVARLKGVSPGSNVNPQDFDSSSRVYTIQKGECFLAQTLSGEILVGRILEIADDTRGAEQDKVRFVYNIFGPGMAVVAP
jgi:PIN like domain